MRHAIVGGAGIGMTITLRDALAHPAWVSAALNQLGQLMAFGILAVTAVGVGRRAARQLR